MESHEERSVEVSEAREARLERRVFDSKGLRRFAGEDLFQRLKLIATDCPMGYSFGDARHQISKDPGERRLRPFRRSRVYLYDHHRGSYGGWVSARPALRDAAFVLTGGSPRGIWRGPDLSVRKPQQGRTRMSAHWRLALGGAAASAVMSLGAAAVVGYYFGAIYAGAFLYGAGVGLVSFSSIAITAWLLGGKLSGERVLLGVAVYFGRLVLLQVQGAELRKEIIHAWESGQHAIVHLSLFGIDISITKAVVFLWIGTALTFLIMFIGARTLKDRPGAYQVIVEEIYAFGRNSMGGQLGEEGRKWFPYTLSLFIYLLVLNLLGLVPNSFPVTSSISFTLVLALLTFVITQIVGVRRNGLWGYVKAFVPPGMPAKPIMVPFMFFIEWVSELSKPLTLAMRLYANILAGHLLIFIFLGFILYTGTPLMAAVSVPVAVVLFGFEIFVAVLQAYIFAILTQVYIEIALYRQEH